jgi:hypothetical protein
MLRMPRIDIEALLLHHKKTIVRLNTKMEDEVLPRTSLNRTPFPEVSMHHFLRLNTGSSFLNPTNIQSPILPIEATHAPHIVSIIGKFVTSETIL